MSIKHLEDLSPNKLLEFVSNWNNDSSTFSITEKIDGNYLSFGLNNNSFFIKTKNKIFTSKKHISDVFFMKDFKRYYSYLEKISLGYPNIIFVGEMVPTFDHNIVMYDPYKIGNGIYVIFNIKIDNKNIVDEDIKNKILINLNEQIQDLKFYFVPNIQIQDFKFNEQKINVLKNTIELNKELLNKPAKIQKQKDNKKEVLKKIKEIGISFKKEFLNQNIKSSFGDELEGIVIQNDSITTKVVDKEKYTERKIKNWFYIDKLSEYKNLFQQQMKQDFESAVENYNNRKSHLKNWQNLIINLEQEFIQNKNKFTIYKKILDTENEFALMKQRANYSELLIEQISNSLYESLKTNYIDEIIFNKANSITNSNSYISYNTRFPTMEKVLKDLDLYDNANLCFVGSDEKYMGDIDIAIDVSDVKNSWNINDNQDLWCGIEKTLKEKKLNYKIIKNFNQFQIITPLYDYSYQHTNAIDCFGNKLNKLGYAQVDFFVGDVFWISRIMSGVDSEKSKYKALYRNILITSIFSQVKWPSKNEKDVFYRFVLDTKYGLKISKRKYYTDKNNNTKQQKIFEKIISNNPDMITKRLFDINNPTWRLINTFEKLYNLYTSNSFKYEEYRTAINKDYIEVLTSLKLPIPKEFKQ